MFLTTTTKKPKKTGEVMGRQKLVSAPGNLIKTTLLKSLAEALDGASSQHSYQNKYEEKWLTDHGQWKFPAIYICTTSGQVS